MKSIGLGSFLPSLVPLGCFIFAHVGAARAARIPFTRASDFVLLVEEKVPNLFSWLAALVSISVSG